MWNKPNAPILLKPLSILAAQMNEEIFTIEWVPLNVLGVPGLVPIIHIFEDAQYYSKPDRMHTTIAKLCVHPDIDNNIRSFL